MIFGFCEQKKTVNLPVSILRRKTLVLALPCCVSTGGLAFPQGRCSDAGCTGNSTTRWKPLRWQRYFPLHTVSEALATASYQTKSLIVTVCPALSVTKENPSFHTLLLVPQHQDNTWMMLHGQWFFSLSLSVVVGKKERWPLSANTDQEFGELSKSFQITLFTINVRFTRKVIWKPIPVLFLCLVPHFWEEAWILKLFKI